MTHDLLTAAGRYLLQRPDNYFPSTVELTIMQRMFGRMDVSAITSWKWERPDHLRGTMNIPFFCGTSFDEQGSMIQSHRNHWMLLRYTVPTEKNLGDQTFELKKKVLVQKKLKKSELFFYQKFGPRKKVCSKCLNIIHFPVSARFCEYSYKTSEIPNFNILIFHILNYQ
jgi:hypothetical protein